MDFPGRLIAGIMAAILIIIFPLQYIAHLHNEDIDILVDDRTHQFTDSIRQKGYLDKDMYEEYVNYLDSTGERYEIEIQDIHPVTGEEEAHTHKIGSFLNVSYSKYNNIQSFSTHTHTADCYAGDLHVCNDTNCEYEGEAIAVAVINGVGIYYSKNGSTWIKTKAPGADYKKVTYGNGKFVAVAPYRAYISTDGINWTEKTYNYTNVQEKYITLYNITYCDNGYFYATGTYTIESSDRNYTTPMIVRSTDGVNWEYMCDIYGSYGYNLAISKHTSRLHVDVTQYANGYGTYYGINTFKINEDGSLTMTSSNIDSENQTSVRQVGDYAVYIEKTYRTRILDSYSIWSVAPDVIQYGNGMFLAVDRISGVVYKGSFPDLTSLPHNLSMPYIINEDMIYFGDKFMFSGYDGSKLRIYSSKDGITWTSSDILTYARPTYLSCNANGGSGEIDRGECLKKGKYYDNNGKEVQPICDRVVKSITATNPVQTVNEGENIITTAIATYLDGHTGIVNCTSNFNSKIIGTQTVTLTYSGLVGNAKTTGTRTCSITVTVKSAKKLTSIVVTPTTQKIQKYSNPTFTVRAYYDDGTNKVLNPSDYKISGFNSAKICTQNITFSYTENGITKSTTVTVTVTPLMRECPRCHNEYELNHDDSDPGCPFCKEIITGIDVSPDYLEVTKGESLPITVVAIYNDGSREVITGWTSNYNPERAGLQIATVEYGGHGKEITVWVNERLIICPVCNSGYPESESECPVCAEKVVNIIADPAEITVMQFEPIPLTVTAFFANGESKVVDDWSIDRNTVIPDTFTATVSYKGVSTTIKLTVLSVFSIQCHICGTIYDISENPKGCPVCSEELIGIEAYLPSGSNLVQLGTTPTIVVILVFRDEHREFAFDGFTLEGFNTNQLGEQTATVRYKEFYTTLILEVVNIADTITCPNGHVYYRNADGTDPGCPFCNTSEEINKVIYFEITYTTDILNEVYSNGVYYFDKGNYISVIVIKKDKSLLYKLQKTFSGTSLPGRKKRFIYGGNIQKT